MAECCRCSARAALDFGNWSPGRNSRAHLHPSQEARSCDLDRRRSGLSAGGGLWGWQGGQRGCGQTPVHLTVALPAGKVLVNNSTRPVAVSPDGSTIVFSAYNEDRKSQLYLRQLDSFESTPIAGTEDGMTPFFSPDGEWLGFVTADNQLKKVLLRGGRSSLTNTAGHSGGAWG